MIDISRKIIHCDCDCFYAAIEIRDNPELAGKPVAVGGRADRRGVLTTCNYEARRFGLHSAMPTARARKLCPELIVLPVRRELYREVSREIQAIYQRYTSLIEPLSLDEAYLDVSENPRHEGSATLLAGEIKQVVRDETGITISAGVAPNKFLAKVASDWDKPDGLTTIAPAAVAGFVAGLPVKKIPGVGEVTAKKMHDAGLTTCADLQALELAVLERRFGKFGQRLHQLCRGQDERPVENSGERKSISTERTFATDLNSLDQCRAALWPLLDELQAATDRRRDRYRIAKIFIKLKFSNFSQTTAEKAGNDLEPARVDALLETAWHRGTGAVRLLGVGVGLLPRENPQLDFFAD